MTDVHRAAREGFTTAATAYARGRPEYPDELLAWLTRELKLGQASRVVDLGAGTGKFTRLLLQTGAQVIAVEPVDAMRDQLAGLSASHAGSSPASTRLQVLPGTAQQLPLPSESVDAVVCAQAFHWFATAEALAEIHRVLRPGGQLGLVWNVRDESVPWVAAITALITPLEGDTPRFHRGDWRKPFVNNPQFSDLIESQYPYQHVGSAQEVIFDRFMSVSFIASLPDEQKSGLSEALQHIVDETPTLVGQSLIAFPYRTLALHCRRR